MNSLINGTAELTKVSEQVLTDNKRSGGRSHAREIEVHEFRPGVLRNVCRSRLMICSEGNSGLPTICIHGNYAQDVDEAWLSIQKRSRNALPIEATHIALSARRCARQGACTLRRIAELRR